MTPGQLVKAVALALDVPEETVVQHDRNLVVAGLRTKGGRGTAAPSVTHRDAARLVAGVLGSLKVKNTVSVVQSLETTRLTLAPSGEDYSRLASPPFAELKPDHSFIDGLTAIIADADTPEMFESFPEFARRFSFEVKVSDDCVAHIFYLPRDDLAYKNALRLLYWPAPRPPVKTMSKSRLGEWSYYTGVEQQRSVRGNCFMMLGLCFQKGVPTSVEAAFRMWRSAAKKAAA
jgi:hypothetical protein